MSGEVQRMSKDPLFVVGIGASAGGLEAIRSLIRSIPPDTGMAFVVVQHLSPDFKSLMDELLGKETDMPVVIPDNETRIEPNHIYLNRRDKTLICRDSYLVFEEKKERYTLPIDIFFHTLGETFQERAVAIILSGTGTDGSRGIKIVKETGGIILVQSPGSAQFDGMPNVAIKTGLPDFVGEPGELAAFLTRLVEREESSPVDKAAPEDFAEVINLVARHSGIDFTSYKDTTLLRRIRKRMDLLHHVDISTYYDLCRRSEEEQNRLTNEFLIGVTSFFRDPEAFDVLRNRVLPVLFNGESTDPIRIWVAGCNTGEEAYSLAIMLEEFRKTSGFYRDYKIFATDVDTQALSVASLGEYPVNIAADVPGLVLQDYFIKLGDTLRISRKIRDKIVFSYHNLLKDPPFIRLDMVSCRNLLIYLQQEAQDYVFELFQFSLNRSGYLFLGHSENLSRYEEFFETINTKWRIFRSSAEKKIIESPRISSGTSVRYPVGFGGRKKISHRRKNEDDNSFYYRNLVDLFAPPCVYMNSRYEVLFFRGEIDRFLSLREGTFSNNLMELLDPKLISFVRNGVRRLEERNHPVRYDNLNIKRDGADLNVSISFRSLASSIGETIYLLEFHDTPLEVVPEPRGESLEISNYAEEQIRDLEQELDLVRAERQEIIEELETSNEELQSSNEELLASNEELQSTNEELQSVNEELYTVNTELQTKNEELESLNADMDNLLESTKIGTLFLDTELCIRKFTPELRSVFRLEEKDIGRQIFDFATNFADVSGAEIIEHARLVMDSLEPIERRIESTEGRRYIKRIHPFVRPNKTVGGVVLTFIDITEQTQTERELFLLNATMNTAFETGRMAWWDWNCVSNELRFDERKARMLGYDPEEIEPGYQGWTKLLHPDDHSAAMSAMQELIEGRAKVYSVEYRLKAGDGSYRWFRDRGEVVESRSDGSPARVLGVVFDIDDWRHLRMAYEEGENRYQTLFSHMSHGVVYHHSDGSIISANPAASTILGLDTANMPGKDSSDPGWQSIREDGSLFPPSEHPIMVALKTGKEIRNVVMGVVNQKEKSRRWIKINAVPIYDGRKDAPVFGFATFDDITDLKSVEARLNTTIMEKDILLRELHHRVKNNLQKIVSIVNLQVYEEKDERIVDILKGIQARIYSMSLVHEKLYRSSEIARLSTGDYLRSLMEEVVRTFQRGIDIRIEQKIEEMNLGIDDCLALGLVLNELVSNSMKYAFTGRKRGKIHVGLEHDPTGSAVLTVADDGGGLPAGFDPYTSESLGMQIVLVLADQLKGELSYRTDKGAVFVLTFYPRLIERDQAASGPVSLPD
jgi:two-component system, chemotaxis family, CheB/CheR fusion protein